MSLTKKAVLVSLAVRCWDPYKRDDEATTVVHRHYRAARDSGRYNKCLIDTKDPAWAAIVRARSDLRTFHYARTLPWIHKGAQLLTAASYLEYNSGILRLIDEYNDVCASFVENDYVRLKAHAARTRNGLYREGEYPSQEELLSKFGAEVAYLPVPDSGHVLVDLVNTEIARIKHHTDVMVAEAERRAQREIWVRLYEPVKRMAEALSDPGRRFHDTLVSNVEDIVRLAPKLDLTGDEGLAAMIDEVKRHLTRAKPDVLRTDPDRRSDVAAKAAALAQKMASLVP